jgi:hypothetical protein
MVWGCLIVGLILFLIARFSVKGKGEYGEDRIYDILQKVDGYKATLPNCYLPKGNGETAEVDLIFLHESGIYVFNRKIIVAGYLAVKIRSTGRNVFLIEGVERRNISSITRCGKMILTYECCRKFYRIRT